MKSKLEIRKKIASSWFRFLQSQICEEFEKIEKRKSGIGKSSVFKKKSWKKSTDPKDGGGMYAVIKNGAVFDSVGVNFSEVSGKFHKKFRAQILGAKKNPNYWASGISVVAHMKNPKIPAMHFNTRFIVTSKSWFGGGMDATPSIKDDEEKKFFHKKIKYTCDKYNKKYYSRYRKWCDKYFYLPHRKETRGIGGIFFDYKKDNWEKDFSFVRNVGLCFLDCAKSIVEKKMKTKWSKKQKNEQLYLYFLFLLYQLHLL